MHKSHLTVTHKVTTITIYHKLIKFTNISNTTLRIPKKPAQSLMRHNIMMELCGFHQNFQKLYTL